MPLKTLGFIPGVFIFFHEYDNSIRLYIEIEIIKYIIKFLIKFNRKIKNK